MRDVVLAAAERAAHPRIEQIKGEGRVDADRRMQRRRRLPSPVTHAADELSRRARCLQRNGPAVASQYIPIRHESRCLDLHALKRGVDIACGSADSAFLAHDVPGLERLTQLDLDAARSEVTVLREAEFH